MSSSENLMAAGYAGGYPAPGTARNRCVIGAAQAEQVTRPTPVQAVLQTGAIETTYHRAGAGAPVLLLFAEGLDDPVAARLFAALSGHFRVIAPVIPAGVAFAPWLRDLIDGLGLDRPGLVSEESLASSSLQFTLGDPDRVAGFVAVRRHGERAAATVSVDPAGDLTDAIARIAALLAAP